MAGTDNNSIKKMRVGDSQYEQLCIESIENLQNLSGDIWTDYNEHDPGVTILENLVYTLTELLYKTDLPVEDLLTRSEGATLKSGDNGMFIASEILTTNPVTIRDYQKLLYDSVANVKNVWVKRPMEESALNPAKGLYHFYIELYDFDRDPKKLANEKERVIKETREVFHNHRNFCENLGSIIVCDPIYLKMAAEIAINDDARAEDILAELFFRIDNHITELIKYYSLQQLAGNDTDEMFEGPCLENGFIKTSDLKDKLQQIELSELTKLATGIDGIKNVISLSLYTDDDEPGKPGNENLSIADGFVPRLLFATGTEKLLYHQKGITFKPDLKEAKDKLSYITAISYGNFRSVSKSVNQLPMPYGTFRDVAYYYPLRYQFPVNYGIGSFGLSKGLPPKRYAQANQLKAFLLPFDQLMANFLAQLNNFYTLFETTEKEQNSNFYQVLDSMPDQLNLVAAKDNNRPNINDWGEILKSLNDDFDNNWENRLNKVADDLLARFSETIPVYFLNMINRKIYGEESVEKFDILSLKRRLLQNYGRISYNRNRGSNYTGKIKSPEDFKKAAHINALVEKISILTGIKNSHFRSLSDEIHQAIKIYDIDIGTKEIDRILNVILPEDGSEHTYTDDIEIIEERENNLHNSFFYRGFSHSILEDCLSAGIYAKNYEIHEIIHRERKHYHIHFKHHNRNSLIHIAHSEQAAIKAVEYAIGFLTRISQESEGMLLLEHILLLPPLEGNYFGFNVDLGIGGSAGKLTVVHTTLKSFAKRNEDCTALISSFTGQKAIQIDIITSANSGFILQFRSDKGEVVGISEQTFETIADATNFKTQITTCLSTENEIPLSGNYQAYYADEAVDESFFSFRMTLILPSWPVRFQQGIFRQKFVSIVSEQTPVHIVTHVLWLKLHRIEEFEKLYYRWFRLNGHRTDEAGILTASYELIRFLQKEGIK